MTPEQIKANKTDREYAEWIANLIDDEDTVGKHPRFWEELIKLAKAKLPATHELNKVSTGNSASQQDKMSYEDAMYFGGTFFPRGIHSESGTETAPIRDCPDWYVLQWAHGDEFTQSLRKYVASDYFRRNKEEHATESSRSVS